MSEVFEKILRSVEKLKSNKGFGGTLAAMCADAKLDEAIKIIQEASEAYNGGWIPCRERLPEREYEVVLVWLSSNGYDIAVWCEEYGFRPWYAIYFDECTPEWEHGVIAWQPLPEPYKAGDQE